MKKYEKFIKKMKNHRKSSKFIKIMKKSGKKIEK